MTCFVARLTFYLVPRGTCFMKTPCEVKAAAPRKGSCPPEGGPLSVKPELCAKSVSVAKHTPDTRWPFFSRGDWPKPKKKRFLAERFFSEEWRYRVFPCSPLSYPLPPSPPAPSPSCPSPLCPAVPPLSSPTPMWDPAASRGPSGPKCPRECPDRTSKLSKSVS